jgi:hypothetical protein
MILSRRGKLWLGNAALGQKRPTKSVRAKSASPPKATESLGRTNRRNGLYADICGLFDCFVSGGKQCIRNGEVHRFGGFHVDYEQVARRYLERKIGGLRALENVGG